MHALPCWYGVRELGFDEAFAFDYESSPITSPFVGAALCLDADKQKDKDREKKPHRKIVEAWKRRMRERRCDFRWHTTYGSVSLNRVRVRRSFQDNTSAKRRELDMWGGIVGLIIQLIAGGVGGNIAGSALKQYNLGTIGNTIAGVIGGGVGAQIIGALLGGEPGVAAAGTGGLDIGSIIGQIASGGVGGGILMVIVGLIKQAMGGQKAA